MDQLRYNGLWIIYLPLKPGEAPVMRVKLQLVLCSDEGREETVTDVMTLNKNSQHIEHLGLTMAEAKQLLSTLQQYLLQHQVDTFLDRCSTCADCGALLKVKAHASRSFRTLFGTYKPALVIISLTPVRMLADRVRSPQILQYQHFAFYALGAHCGVYPA